MSINVAYIALNEYVILNAEMGRKWKVAVMPKLRSDPGIC
jgi:hypothetical protein